MKCGNLSTSCIDWETGSAQPGGTILKIVITGPADVCGQNVPHEGMNSNQAACRGSAGRAGRKARSQGGWNKRARPGASVTGNRATGKLGEFPFQHLRFRTPFRDNPRRTSHPDWKGKRPVPGQPVLTFPARGMRDQHRAALALPDLSGQMYHDWSPSTRTTSESRINPAPARPA